MPTVKLYTHFIWSTKNREPFLNNLQLRNKVWQHIQENAKVKEIFIDTIGGHNDHCHCLISMSIDQNCSKVMQLIKGESAHWINKNALCKQKFEWQDEYYALSVSLSVVNRVRDYIINQEMHHKDKSFQDECSVLGKEIEASK